MSIDILKDIICKVDTQNRITPTIFGPLRSIINDNIVIYDSNNEFIDTIIAYYKDGILVRMSFAGEKIQMGINELIMYLGICSLTYNYRDNYTQFNFCLDKIGGTIKRVFFKRDNKIEYDSIHNSYTVVTPFGQQMNLVPEKMSFNNFTLEFTL